jgi:hypothetical protein
MRRSLLLAAAACGALALSGCDSSPSQSAETATSEHEDTSEIRPDTPAESQETGRNQTNFLLGKCIIPDTAEYDRCSTDDLLESGTASAYFIFRKNFMELHVAVPNNDENGSDGSSREIVKNNPVIYKIDNDQISVISKVDNRDGPCLVEEIYKQSGNIILSKHGQNRGNCELQNAIIKRQNLIAGVDGNEFKQVRYTTGN